MDRIINHIASNSAWSDHTATFYQDNRVIRLSLSELDREARRVAARLKDLGLRRGDRIGILARNSLEWVLLDLAAIKLQVVTAGFEHGAFAPDEKLRSDYGLALVFSDHGSDTPGFLDIRALRTEAAPEPLEQPTVSYADDDFTTIKFTSGSTGRPKGLAATVGSIDSSIDAVQRLFHHGAGDKILVFLPLSLLQQRYWLYSALYYGHDFVLVRHEFALYAMKQERPTVVMGVPSFFDAMKQQIESKAVAAAGAAATQTELAGQRPICAAELTGGRIRYLWTGSAPAKPDMLRYLDACNLPIFEGYGMNETCIVSKNAPGSNRVGSVGKVLDRKQVIVDESGALIVRSDYPVNRRYLFCENEQAQRIFAANGDVLTGDLGYIDEDGYLYIQGRADDTIALGNGKNVFARPIEDLIRRSAAVAECILVGAGRPHLVAVVSPAGGAVDRGAIESHVKWVNTQVRGYERVGKVVIAREPFSVENGLLTSQGKPRRARIRGEYEMHINEAYGDAT